MLNSCQIIGNVGNVPDKRFTPSGKPVCDFKVAVDSPLPDDKKITEWFNVVTWNKLAETCETYIFKGMRVFVEGRIQTHSWDATDGQKKYKTELIARRVIFLTPRSNGQEVPEHSKENEDVPF